MFRIDRPSAAAEIPIPSAAGTPGYFTDGNPTTGTGATIVTADWLNAVQEELANAITESGVTLDKSARAQLYKAISGTKASNIISATTINLGTVQGDFVDITGTTAITSFGLAPHAGIMKTVRFTDTLTLIYNASSLLLPGKTNITTAANDVAVFRALDTSGNWICLNYTKSNGENFSTAPFIDTNPIVVGSSDATKKLRFEVDGLTTGVTRVATMPDSNINLNHCAFFAYANNPQNIGAVTISKALLNTKLFDNNSYFDNTTSYRFTPLISGYYIFFGQSHLTLMNDVKGNATYIYKNGVPIATGQQIASAGNQGLIANVSVITQMNGTTDYIELYIENGDSVTRGTISGSGSTFICGYKLP